MICPRAKQPYLRVDFLPMSSNLAQQIALTSRSTALAVAPPLSNVTKVQTLRGQLLYLPSHQIPQINPNDVIKNPWAFNGDGNYSTALQGGTSIQNIKIARGQGSGKTTGRVWLHMNVTNSSGSSVQTVPVPFWFTNLNLQTPGGDIIQNYDPWGLWFSIISTTSIEEWESMSDLILASNNYQSGNPITGNSTVDIWVPLVGNPYTCGEIATRELEGDSMFYASFATSSSWITSGPTNSLTINSFQLVFEMQQLDSSLIASLDAEYAAMPHDTIYPFQRVMNFTQTFNTNSQYSFQLSGITGDVCFIEFLMRNSLSQWDLYHALPITSYQFQNQEGIPISGAQFIPAEYARWGLFPQWFLGTWMQDRRYYGWSFSAKNSSPVEFLLTGRKNGAYGFTGNEQLVLNTAGAGTSEVINFTATNTAAIAAGSNCYFSWTDEYGVTFNSEGFDLSTQTNTQIKNLIEGIDNFEGTCTVSALGSAPYNFSVTYGGNYANRPMTANGFSLKLVGTVQFASGNPNSMLDSVTTPGVRGITNGQTATLTVVAWTSSILNVTKGRQRVQNS